MAEDVVHNIDINLNLRGQQAVAEMERVFKEVAGGAGGSVSIGGGSAANLTSGQGYEQAARQFAEAGARLQQVANLSGKELQAFATRVEALTKALVSGGSSYDRHVQNSTSAASKVGREINVQQLRQEAETKAIAASFKAAGISSASGALINNLQKRQQEEAPGAQRVVATTGTRKATAKELAEAAANPDENRTRARQILRDAEQKFLASGGGVRTPEDQQRADRLAAIRAKRGVPVEALEDTERRQRISREADQERAAKKAADDRAKQQQNAAARKTIQEEEDQRHQQRFGTGVAFPAHGAGLAANPAADRTRSQDTSAELARQAKEQRAFALSSVLTDFGRGYRIGPAQTIPQIGPGHPWYGGPEGKLPAEVEAMIRHEKTSGIDPRVASVLAERGRTGEKVAVAPPVETEEQRRARIIADVAAQRAASERRDKLREAGLNPYATSGIPERAPIGRKQTPAEQAEADAMAERQRLANQQKYRQAVAQANALINFSGTAGLEVAPALAGTTGSGGRGGPPPKPPTGGGGPPEEPPEDRASRRSSTESLMEKKRADAEAADGAKASAKAVKAVSAEEVQAQVAKRAYNAELKRQVTEVEVRNGLERRGIPIAEGTNAADLAARLAAAQKAEVIAEQVRVLRVILGKETESLTAESGVVALSAEKKALLKQQNDLIEKQAKALGPQAPPQGPASLFQRLSASVRRRTGGEPVDASTLPTLGQQIGQSAIRSASFAVAGGGVYTVVSNLRTLVQESERVQIAVGQLHAQLNAVGKGADFGGIRDSFLGMARDSGLAADEVLKLGSIMLGAFSNSTKEALDATQAGLALVQVGGLSVDDVLNNLVAVTKSFGFTGSEAMNKIDDQALHLKDTFGVSVKEIIDGVGNIAPLANELGLSFKEASTLIAGASAVSGRSATQTANEIGRALTQIGKNAPAILAIFDQPNTQGALKNIQKDLAGGNIGQVLIETIRNWKNLTKAQQETFLTLIGGRREFASLAAALGASDKIIAELDDKSNHYGRTAQSLAEYHKSLSYQIKTAKESLFQFGNAILQSPLGAGLGIIVHSIADLARWVGTLLHWLSNLNALTGGLSGEFLSWAAAIAAVVKGTKALAEFRITRSIAKGTESTGAASVAAAHEESAVVLDKAIVGAHTTGGAAVATEIKTALGTGGAGAAEEISVAMGTAGAANAEEMAAAIISANEASLAAMKLTMVAGGTLNTAALAGETVATTGIMARLGSAAAPLAGAFTALLPIIAAFAELKIGAWLGAKIAGATAGRESGVDVKTKSTGGILGLGFLPTRTEISNAEEIAGASSKQFDKMSLEQVRAIAEQHHAGIGLPGTGETLSVSPGHTAARNVRIDAARQYVGQSLGEHGNQQYNRDIVEALRKSKAISNKRADDLLKGVDDNDYNTYKKVTELYNDNKNKKGFTGQLGKSRAASQHQQLVANVLTGNTLQSAQDIVKTYDSGRGSYEQEQTDLQRRIDELRNAISGAPTGTANTLQMQKDLNDAIDLQTQSQKKQSDELLKTLDIQGQTAAIGKGRAASVHAATDTAKRNAASVAGRVLKSILGSGPRVDQSEIAGVQNALATQAEAERQVTNDTKIAGLQATQAVHAAGGDQVQVARDDVTIAEKQLSFAHGDLETAQAQANLTQKKRALVQAQLQTNQSRQALQRDLLAAQSGDPLSAARNALTNADEAAAVASRLGNVYDQLQAQKARVEANRTLQDLIAQIGQAQLDLAIAYADAAGDVNQVAGLQTEKATKALNDYLASHPGSSEANDPQVSQLKAAVVNAQNNQRRTANNEQISNIDFLQQAGKITVQNAIASLQAILSTMKEGTQEYRDLYLKIEGLKKSAAGNVGFNVPTSVKLPTLYESRRLETAGTGANYDQRQVTVTMYVNNGMDEQRAADFLSNTLGGRRSGTVPRSY